MLMVRDAENIKMKELGLSFEKLCAQVEDAAGQGKPIHEVEREIWAGVLGMGRSLMGLYLKCQGTGDLGQSIRMSDGHEVRRLQKLHRRLYKSIFGTFELDRAVYGSREGQRIEFVPLDARLELPDSEFSYVLQDWSQALGVEHAFAKSRDTLQRILGVGVSVDSLERGSREMAVGVAEFRESYPAPKACEEGSVLVVTADNKGVPMCRPADELPAGCHRNKGEKANKKQMATIGCVYTVDPNIRTAQEVVAALFREEYEPRGDHPKARQKRVSASLSVQEEGECFRGEDIVFAWIEGEARRRLKSGQPVACVMDGQHSLWNMRQDYLPLENVVEILDLLHVAPRLWEAAHLFHAETSPEARLFVRERLLRILLGEVGPVIGGLRQMGTKHALRAAKRTKLKSICNYLENNRSRMRYDQYLAAGYPIASGVIEGACRHVVKDRMERAGMRWVPEGAQATLDLRTTYINDQWDEFQTYRIEQERQQLYHNQDILEQVEWPIAA